MPRQMHRRIRYWNGWLIRLLLPELRFRPARNQLRRVPICRNATGYVTQPRHARSLALALTGGWMLVVIRAILWAETL